VNAVVILVLFGLMQALRAFGGPAAAATSIGTSVGVGYLLLTGYFVGRIFADLGLPRLTGYVLTGIAVGPSALGLVNQRMVDSLTLVNGMAAALVALSAGIDFDLRAMRPLFRAMFWITLTGVLGTVLLLALALFVGRPWLSFLAPLATFDALVIALLLALVMVAQAPAVIVALNDELGARGPVARTSLGLVVISDLVVILLFAVMTPIAKATLGNGGDLLATVRNVAWELGGSLVAGCVLGYILAVYLAKVRGGGTLFLLALTFIIAEVGHRLQFDPLLVALAAGVLIRNGTRAGDAVYEAIEGSALPLYVLFFSVAGMTLPLGVLATVGLPALALVLLRAGGLVAGARLGAGIAAAPREVRQHAGFGLLPQATLTIALAGLVANNFPRFGPGAQALALSMVAINMVLAPVAYRLALVRGGETARRAGASPEPTTAPQPGGD